VACHPLSQPFFLYTTGSWASGNTAFAMPTLLWPAAIFYGCPAWGHFPTCCGPVPLSGFQPTCIGTGKSGGQEPYRQARFFRTLLFFTRHNGAHAGEGFPRANASCHRDRNDAYAWGATVFSSSAIALTTSMSISAMGDTGANSDATLAQCQNSARLPSARLRAARRCAA